MLPDEIVWRYGMGPGRRGPDIISVSPDGEISVWDSKWRSSPQSIGDGAAAHQSTRSLWIALNEMREQIDAAVKSGRIAGETATKAKANAKEGNLFINTVGTGEAHGAVVRCVRKEKYGDCWSN